MRVPNIVNFWIVLIVVIPSTLFSIFGLVCFLLDRTLRQALNNHVIIVILGASIIFNLTDMIWFIYYFRTSSALSSTYAFCLTWTYFDFAVYTFILILVAWATVERHILIFHPNLVATKMKRIVVHYLPLIVFTCYPFIYYIFIILVLPCDIPVNYSVRRCGLGNCPYSTQFTYMWDTIVHSTLPAFIIVIFSIALIGRVWYNKYRMGQRFQWRNYRKMIIQLLVINTIYIIMYFPALVLFIIYLAGITFDGIEDVVAFAAFDMFYFVLLFTPILCSVSLPELRTKLQKIIRIGRRTRRAVAPEALTLTHIRNRATARITPIV